MNERKPPDGADEIAADDAGAGALGRNTGQTAGGDASVRFTAPPDRPGEIAAADAGGTVEAVEAVEAAEAVSGAAE